MTTHAGRGANTAFQDALLLSHGILGEENDPARVHENVVEFVSNLLVLQSWLRKGRAPCFLNFKFLFALDSVLLLMVVL
jgi:hypothetical protein